jgi:hypothetical protein
VLGAAAFAGGSNAAGIAAALVKVSTCAVTMQGSSYCMRRLLPCCLMQMLLLGYDGHMLLTR